MSTEPTEVVTTDKPAANPFAREHLPAHVNAGAVTIESDRAVAEAQGKLIIAKRFPRDEARAFVLRVDPVQSFGVVADRGLLTRRRIGT